MKLKTATFIVGMAVALNIVACAQNSRDEVDSIAKQMEDGGDKKTAPENEDTGGQPAKILLSGLAVQSDGGKIILPDSRISVKQELGLNEKGELKGVVDKEHLPSYERWSLDESLETLESDKTYINIGCPTPDEELVKDLTEAQKETAEGIIQVQAHTVLICGAQKIPSNYIAVKAHKLILNTVAFKGAPSSGVSLSANNVTLVGASSILVKDYMSHEGLTVGLNVNMKLEGQGTLEITTIGVDDDVIAAEAAEQVIEQNKEEDSAANESAEEAPEVTEEAEQAKKKAKQDLLKRPLLKK